MWIAPALTLFALPVVRRYWWLSVPSALIFLVGPHWLFPRDNDVERNWEWWQQVIGNAYVWFGLAVVVGFAFTRWSHRPVSD
jgi:alpha-1,2-mannosyltransferase